MEKELQLPPEESILDSEFSTLAPSRSQFIEQDKEPEFSFEDKGEPDSEPTQNTEPKDPPKPPEPEVITDQDGSTITISRGKTGWEAVLQTADGGNPERFIELGIDPPIKVFFFMDHPVLVKLHLQSLLQKV